MKIKSSVSAKFKTQEAKIYFLRSLPMYMLLMTLIIVNRDILCFIYRLKYGQILQADLHRNNP